MKVILLQHVQGLGAEGEIREVSEGYARNFLLPRRLADIATPDLIKRMTMKKEKESKIAKHNLIETEKSADALEGRIFEMSAKATKEGTLYAAISALKISEILIKKGFQVQPKQIITENIKEVGEHEIIIRFAHNLESKITLIVTAEGGAV